MALMSCALPSRYTQVRKIHIRFTCKEKLPNDKRIVEKPEDFKRGDDIDKGIVKWLVEMIDETGEVTGIATILTMVAKNRPVKLYRSVLGMYIQLTF